MALTEAKIKKLQFNGKNLKITDHFGLYLLVAKKSKRFYCRYTYRKKQYEVAIGQWPFLSLADARQKVFNIRSNLAHNNPPVQYKISDKTFGQVADEFLDNLSQKIAFSTFTNLMRQYNRYIRHSELSSIRISEVTTQDILKILSPLRKQNKNTLVKKLKSLISRTFRYGIEHYGVQNDPTHLLSRLNFSDTRTRHHPHIADKEKLGKLLADIDAWDFSPVSDALRLLPYVFVRFAELVSARVEDFNLEEALWQIPAANMKQRRIHIVPLPKPAMMIVKRRIEFAKDGFLFPSFNEHKKYISRSALSKRLKSLCDFEVCLHSFRSTASTFLHELGFHSDLIELQLSHKVRNATAASYNFHTFLDERRDMLQVYADFLDDLKVNFIKNTSFQNN